MNNRARILFIVGSAGLAIGGLLHMYGQFGGGDPPFTRAAIEAAMRAYKIEAMGMSFSLMDVMQSWGVCFGVLMIYGGVQNLIAVSLLPRSKGLGVLAGWSALCVAVLLGLGIAYHIAPPIIIFSVVFLCFAAATVLSVLSNPTDGGTA
jgi:hypothetical protein